MVVLVAVVALLGFARLNKPSLPPHVVKGDGEGYYAYLPAYLVDHDASFATLVRRHLKTPELVGLSGLSFQSDSRRYLDKYSPGEAVLGLPFFVVGHEVAVVRGERADGYSRSEEIAFGLGAIAWGIAGLVALRRLLLRRFGDIPTAAALVAIAFGTSLLHYLAFDSSYSHAFSFAAVSLALLAAVRWRERPASRLRAVELGLAVGLVLCIRPANVVAIAPLVLLGVVDRPSARARARYLRCHWRPGLLAAAAALPLVLANLLAWRFAAGHLVLFSYRQDERFSFLHPQWRVLYSFRPHGLLPYAPVLFLVAPGLVALWRRARDWFWTVALSLLLQTYLLASWGAWPLGDGFGQRGFVDVGAVLAVPLAALFAAVLRSRWRWAVGGLAAVAVLTTVSGTLAYWQDRLPHDGASRRGYLAAVTGGEGNRP